jgi:hypothetical protein
MDGSAIELQIRALSFIRNGFAHRTRNKTHVLPPHGRGVLWVEKADGLWSVQKPHAMSSLRLCHVAYRWVVESVWGRAEALRSRSPLPQYASDRYQPTDLRDPAAIMSEISAAFENGDRRRAFKCSRELQVALWARRKDGTNEQLVLDGTVSALTPIFDRLADEETTATPTTSGSSVIVAPQLFT